MKKWIKKTIFSTFLFVVAILSTVTVSALTITETVDEDIADGTIIMGITKFEPNVVITALRASDATFNDVIFNYNKPNYKGVNIYYLLSGSWFEIDEENNAHPIENEELIQQLNEVDIYYVNNNEKMLEISYSENVPTGYELIFETNNSAKNDEIKYEAGKIKVPATINEVKVLLQNTETKEKEIIDVFEKNARNDVTFVNTSTMDVTNLVQLKDALNNKDIKTINITKNITDVAERIVIDRKVEVNGNGNKITFTSAVNEAAYGSRHGILVNADDVTITDLVVEMDANTNDLTWTGTYGIQVFESKGVILNNITATKADGGLFANDSTVTLTGTITLSGNEFGGMEVSNGTATLNAKGATIVNTSERYAQPTIWTDSENAVVNSNLISAKIRDGQKQYYLEEANTTLNNIEDFKVALSIKTINTLNIGANFTGLTERIVIDRKVEVNGNGNKITFTSAVNEAAYGSRHGILVNADDVTITDLVVEMDANTNDLTWTGTYGIQVYDATGVVINNYTGTKADAALMLNGSEVELTGTTTVTGNEFGGIEVSKGTAPNNSKLTVAGTVVSTDEDVNCPAIWLIDGQGTILGGTFYTKANVTDQGVAQTYYFLNELLATN